MIVLAYGAKKVREMERAMGGTPPKGALKESQVWLQRYAAERFKKKQSSLAETSRLAEGWRELLFSNLAKDDPRLKQLKEHTQAALKGRKRRKIERPKPSKIEPRIIMGSNLVLKAPPYDDVYLWQSDSRTIAQADASIGHCKLEVQAWGNGSMAVQAGVWVWYYSPEDNPWLRFGALLDYSDDWWDSANGYVAHSDMRTRLWVWGANENDFVLKSDQSPSWSDGVGWYEDHGNDPNGEAGRISIETHFPAKANSWYAGLVWFDASVYGDGGFFGFGASSIHFDCDVRMVVFGSK